MPDIVTCPNCSYPIELSAALSDQIRENLRKQYDAEARRKEIELAKRDQALRQRELAVEESRRILDQEVAERVASAKEQLRQEAATRASEAVAHEVNDLKEQLAQAKGKVQEAQQAELELRKQRRELETQREELELSVSRRLDEERRRIRDEAKREADEAHRLREADKDKLVSDLRGQIDELKRKAEQGSQQAQGEVMELDLEDLLRQHFLTDAIEPVPSGTHGGDILQHVHDDHGLTCGTILWESKRTKAWNDGWLPKLRDNQRAGKAHLAALLTAELPKDVANFSCIDGIWVTNRSCLVGLASALRAGLIEAARARRCAEGKQTKFELVYQYLSGLEFRQRIEGIVEAFLTMKDDLESEKRSIQRLWAKREKQLTRAMVHTVSLHGDLGGIIGATMPQIPNLELPAIATDLPSDEEMLPAEMLTDSPF